MRLCFTLFFYAGFWCTPVVVMRLNRREIIDGTRSESIPVLVRAVVEGAPVQLLYAAACPAA